MRWGFSLLCLSACGGLVARDVPACGDCAWDCAWCADPDPFVASDASLAECEQDSGVDALEAGDEPAEVRHFMFCGPTELTCEKVCDASLCSLLAEHTWCCRE